MRTKKSKRRRVARETVKANAAESAGTGAGNWMDLPEGVREWHPETAGVQRIDIVPYVVTSEAHPDRIEKDCLWYKYPFMIHYGIGVENQAVVCPVSVGQPCPICEERNRLAKDWAENEEICKSLRAQRWVMYNILDPDDPERIAVFSFSRGKFASVLEAELTEGDEENLDFYDVTDGGRTLKVRFSKDSFEGRAFLKATRLDFLQREVMDEDKILAKTVCLDEILQVWEYDKLKTEFLQSAAAPSSDDDADDEDEDEAPKPKKPKPKKPKPRPDTPLGDEDDWNDEDDEDEVDEDEADEESEPTIPDRPLPKPDVRRGPKPVPESEEDEDDDWADDEDGDEDEDEDEDEEEAKPKKKRGPKPKKAAKVLEDDDIPFDEDGDEADDEPKPKKKAKKKPGPKPKKKVKKAKKKPGPKPKKGADDDDWDEDE